MSLSRAFTTRKAKPSEVPPHRSNTTKIPNVPGGIRNKISGPVALVHTTNMLSYNAPDIVRRPTGPPPPTPPSPPTTSGSSTAGGSNQMPMIGEALTPTKSTESDSDGLYLHSPESTPPTSPDISAAEERSKPEPNHLSCYFVAPGTKAPSSTVATKESHAQPSVTGAPTIPTRAPSHTKRSHEVVAHRQRSSSRVSAQSNASHATKASTTSFNFSRPASNTTAVTSLTSPTSSVAHSTKPSVSSISSTQPNHFRQTHASTASSVSTNSTGHQQTPPPMPAPFTTAPIVISVPHPGLLGSHKKAPSRTDSLKQKAAPAQSSQQHHAAHPFGKELAKVSEIAEEYAAMERAVSGGSHSRGGSNNSSSGIHKASRGDAKMTSRFDDDTEDEETREMRSKGLFRFAPEVYIDEIQSLISAMFSDLLLPPLAPAAKGPSTVWI